LGDVIAAMLASVAALAVAAASLLVDAGHVTELSVAEEQPIGTLVGRMNYWNRWIRSRTLGP